MVFLKSSAWSSAGTQPQTLFLVHFAFKAATKQKLEIKMKKEV